EDAARVRAVREAVGDKVELMVDANYLFSFPVALDLAKRIEPYGIKWFEEPVYGNDARLLANLRRQTRIPISAGQNEGHKWRHRELLVHEAVDILQPNVVYVGGYTEGVKDAAMKCSRCQHENPVGVKFCGECGARLETACLSCGASLVQAAPSSKFSSPQTYTPKHLAEKILTSKNSLEGERKQVTVLFADTRGSMELLADRDPEEARKLLDPVIEHMMEAVHRYEGTVSNLMGDGIMALFGAPLAHEDHAVRACYAALRMQESVTRYGDLVQRSHGVPLQIRVGLNSGDVVVRSIGSDLRTDYTAVGQTAHLAARMEQMAKPASILLTADCL